MTTQPEPTDDDEPTGLEKTADLMRRLLKVPKSEVEKLRKERKADTA